MKRIVKFFSSIKLAIILLICLAFSSIIGTLIAQKANPALYIQNYGEGLYKFFKFIGFFDVYHSPWFILLLVLLSVNILFCTLRRLPRDLKRIRSALSRFTDDMAKKYRLSHSKVFHRPLTECKDALCSLLKKNGLGASLQQEEISGNTFLFSEKNRNGWLFFYLTHISILIILLGGIISAATGVKGYLQITEGASADNFYEYGSKKVYALDFTVRCDKFEIEYYPNTMRPKDYRSHLTILDEGKEMLSKVIEVNQPLTYKGMTLYQSSYGEDTQFGELLIEVKPMDPKSDKPVQNFRVSPGGNFEFTGVDGKKRQVKAVRFLPDFGMDSNGHVFSKSDQMRNPAVQLMITKEGEEPFLVWGFSFPDFHMIKKGQYIYTFKDYKGKMYTGLQVGKDPGVWIVWIGCILLMLGVILVLFSSHQRVWARLSPSDRGCTIQVIGHADKNKIGFENKLNQVWQELLALLKN
ncbi:MAG: cytochrome c biogenesis protein ResB [bacterium]